MKEIEMLQAVYDEKKAAYSRLCDAYSKAMEAANEIKAMCDEAQDDMLKSGEKLLKAMKVMQQ